MTSGLLTIFQIVARILAAGFPVALHWLAFLRVGVVWGSPLYPVDLMQRVSPELSDQLDVRHCSVKTGLIDGYDHLEKQLNVLRAVMEVC